MAIAGHINAILYLWEFRDERRASTQVPHWRKNRCGSQLTMACGSDRMFRGGKTGNWAHRTAFGKMFPQIPNTRTSWRWVSCRMRVTSAVYYDATCKIAWEIITTMPRRAAIEYFNSTAIKLHDTAHFLATSALMYSPGNGTVPLPGRRFDLVLLK
jgi:hypothetical protein